MQIQKDTETGVQDHEYGKSNAERSGPSQDHQCKKSSSQKKSVSRNNPRGKSKSQRAVLEEIKHDRICNPQEKPDSKSVDVSQEDQSDKSKSLTISFMHPFGKREISLQGWFKERN